MNHNRAILSLALPSIVSNITVPLLGMVDTAIVGHMGDARYIAAIALGGTAFSMMYWVFAFLRMSTSGLIAQAYGAGNEPLAMDVLRKSFLLAVAIASLILLLQFPLFHGAALLTVARAEALDEFATYFFTCVWGAPAILLNYSLSGWFVGRQDTRTPMYAAILQNVMNIVLSAGFVYLCNMGIRGVALGTVLGAWSGTLYMAFCLRRFVRPLLMIKGQGIGWGSLFSINRDIFLRTLCLVAVTVYFTRAGSEQTAGVLEANAILMQLFIFFSFFIDGFANAGEALSGRFYGAGDMCGLRDSIRALFRWGAGMALAFALLYFLAGQYVLQLLTNHQQVLAVAAEYLPWLCVMPLLAFPAFVWDGIYIGLTRSRQMFMSMLLAMLVFFVLWFALRQFIQNHALWLAFDAYLLTRGMMQWWMYSMIKVL